MTAAPFGPVGRYEIEIGSGREPPELVGEAEVVTDERRDAHTVDLDLNEGITGTKVAGLAAERERMDLAVAVHGAVGTGKNKAVGGSRVGRVRVGGYLGAAAADPHSVQCRLLYKELR